MAVRVLIVDDAIFMRRMIADILKKRVLRLLEKQAQVLRLLKHTASCSRILLLWIS